MRPLTITLLATCLLATAVGLALTQEPSPAPPPWFGGRVEMHEHGFAVTRPGDWVAFDTTVDTLSQLEAASEALDPLLWSTDDAGFLDALAVLASEGMQLWSGHVANVNSCVVGAVYRGSGVAPDAVEAFAACPVP